MTDPIAIIPTPSLIARALSGWHGDTVTVRYWARRGNLQPYALMVFDEQSDDTHTAIPLPAVGVRGLYASDVSATLPIAQARALADLPTETPVYYDGDLHFGTPPAQKIETPAPQPLVQTPQSLAPSLEDVLSIVLDHARRMGGGRIHASVRPDKVVLAVQRDSVVIVTPGQIIQRWQDGAEEFVNVNRLPTAQDVIALSNRIR